MRHKVCNAASRGVDHDANAMRSALLLFMRTSFPTFEYGADKEFDAYHISHGSMSKIWIALSADCAKTIDKAFATDPRFKSGLIQMGLMFGWQFHRKQGEESAYFWFGRWYGTKLTKEEVKRMIDLYAYSAGSHNLDSVDSSLLAKGWAGWYDEETSAIAPLMEKHFFYDEYGTVLPEVRE